MKTIFKSAIIAVALFSATAAQAANAIVTTNLNIRTGPGTKYRVIGSIPNGARVDVRGCTSGYGWCQVNYAGRYGWASSRYLAVREGSSGNYSNNNFGTTAAAIGIPLIAGVIIGSAISNNNDRWDRPYYRPHRPYYRPHRPYYRPHYRPGWHGHRPYRPGWNGKRPHRSGWVGYVPAPRRGEGPHGQ